MLGVSPVSCNSLMWYPAPKRLNGSKYETNTGLNQSGEAGDSWPLHVSQMNTLSILKPDFNFMYLPHVSVCVCVCGGTDRTEASCSVSPCGNVAWQTSWPLLWQDVEHVQKRNCPVSQLHREPATLLLRSAWPCRAPVDMCMLPLRNQFLQLHTWALNMKWHTVRCHRNRRKEHQFLLQGPVSAPIAEPISAATHLSPEYEMTYCTVSQEPTQGAPVPPARARYGKYASRL
jgi:hypothetical protein